MFVISTLATHRSHSSADDRGTFTIIITSCTTVLAAPLSSALQTCVNNESIISLQHCSTAALQHREMVSRLYAAQLRTLLQVTASGDRDSDTADGASNSPLLLNE